MYEDFFSRNHTVSLQISGGKDSIATLHWMRDWWSKVIVMWVNTGDAFPETVAQMREVRRTVPHFLEITSEQPRDIEDNGPPSDLLSSWDMPLGRQFEGGRDFKVQTPFSCCANNIWFPMAGACLRLGVTGIIRGQRKQERRKSPVTSGFVDGQFEYLFPIEDWTEGEVWAYLNEQNATAGLDHYRHFNSSLDCQRCTAYWDKGKMRYLSAFHPETHLDVLKRLRYIERSVETEMRNLRELLRN